MPWSASSNRPRRSASAPVNAPRAWPNSSASMRSSLRAAQLSAQKARGLRGPSRCRARATNSFPLPLSPSTTTWNGARAARATSRRRATTAWLVPSMPPTAEVATQARRSSAARTQGATPAATAVSQPRTEDHSSDAVGWAETQPQTIRPMATPPRGTGSAASGLSPRGTDGISPSSLKARRQPASRSSSGPSAASLVTSPRSRPRQTTDRAATLARIRPMTFANASPSSSVSWQTVKTSTIPSIRPVPPPTTACRAPTPPDLSPGTRRAPGPGSRHPPSTRSSGRRTTAGRRRASIRSRRLSTRRASAWWPARRRPSASIRRRRTARRGARASREACRPSATTRRRASTSPALA